MKAVIQRSKQAKVTVQGNITGEIPFGFVVLLAVTHDDTVEDAQFVANKVAQLRVFEDEQGKMNHSLLDVGGDILSISQFTLYADTRKGRRPNFMRAAKPDCAKELYETFNTILREKGIRVETGEFGAMMDVQLTNDGPVTLIVESKEK